MDNYGAIVTVTQRQSPVDTTQLFDQAYVERDLSPLDQFFSNCVQLNRLWLNGSVPPELGRLLLLGYVSAVESYMRSLISRLVHIDPYCANKCHSHVVSYGAAIHHKVQSLADALLEETVFSTAGNIENALKKFAGIEKIQAGTKKLIGDFNQLCHLRHCCTHRFGKLGVKNAIELGFSKYKPFIEKPVTIDSVAIQEVADVVFNLVKAINNDVFSEVMSRTVLHKNEDGTMGVGWFWHKTRDRARFKNYYDIFSSIEDSLPSPSSDEVYEAFRKHFRKAVTKSGRRHSGQT